MESFGEVSAQQGGERAGGAASGTVDAEKQVDGAGGVEARLGGRIDEQRDAQKSCRGEQQMGETLALRRGQMAAPR